MDCIKYDKLIDVLKELGILLASGKQLKEVFKRELYEDVSEQVITELRRVIVSLNHLGFKPLDAANIVLFGLMNTHENYNPLLLIELPDIDSVPIVSYKGEEINKKIRVSFDYGTESDEHLQRSYIHIEHLDPDSDKGNIKVIQHNYPIDEEGK